MGFHEIAVRSWSRKKSRAFESAFFSRFVEGLKDMAKCKYCGTSTTAGGGCSKSPTKTHVVYEPLKCIYCGVKTTAGEGVQKAHQKATLLMQGLKNASIAVWQQRQAEDAARVHRKATSWAVG